MRPCRPLLQNGHICTFSRFEKTTFLDLNFNQLGSVLCFMGDVFKIRELFHIKHISDEIVLYLLSCVPLFR